MQLTFLTTRTKSRVAALLHSPSSTEDQKLEIFSGYKRLVESMGEIYMAMALTSLPNPFEQVPGFPPPSPPPVINPPTSAAEGDSGDVNRRR